MGSIGKNRLALQMCKEQVRFFFFFVCEDGHNQRILEKTEIMRVVAAPLIANVIIAFITTLLPWPVVRTNTLWTLYKWKWEEYNIFIYIF